MQVLPLDLWQGIFGNGRPVAVEIGPGRGDFLVASARSEPESNFFAIERSGSRALRLRQRVDARGLGNVRVLQADATCVLELLPDACVERYHVQFPDPWWKKRHARRRLWTPAFVSLLRRTLRPGGSIELVTDVGDYFAFAQTLLDAQAGLQRESAGPTEIAATSFARKALARGDTLYRSEHRRREGNRP
jgi:tRNA (guanine-N7-)-methyltransferase